MKGGYNKVALVTGGSRGIGRSICEALLSDGWEVVFFARDERASRAFAGENGGSLSFIRCDVSVPEEVERACGDALAAHGTVSALINNAGIQTHESFLEMSAESWDRTINTNLNSMFHMCKAIAPAMVEQGYGRIVNMSSMSAIRGSNRHVHYCAAKAGVLGFTRALSYELAHFGVTVNAVCPGVVETEIIREYADAKREEWLSQMHVKRLGVPEDIANAVRFLVSEDSGWISGQAIHVNGGILTP